MFIIIRIVFIVLVQKLGAYRYIESGREFPFSTCELLQPYKTTVIIDLNVFRGGDGLRSEICCQKRVRTEIQSLA